MLAVFTGSPGGEDDLPGTVASGVDGVRERSGRMRMIVTKGVLLVGFVVYNVVLFWWCYLRKTDNRRDKA